MNGSTLIYSGLTLPTLIMVKVIRPRNPIRVETLHIEDIPIGQDCPICLGEFSIQNNIVKLPCNHVFDKACVSKWFKTKDECPICRFKNKKLKK